MDKTFEVIKTLVKNTLDNEFNHIQNENFEDMKEASKKEYENARLKSTQLYEQICTHLPEELHQLVSELMDEMTNITCIEERYYFNRGVVASLTNLDYLQEVGPAIMVMYN